MKYKKVVIIGTLLMNLNQVVYAETPLGWRGNSFYKTDEDRYEKAKTKEELDKEKIEKENKNKSISDIIRNIALDIAQSAGISDISGKVSSGSNSSTISGTASNGANTTGGDGKFYSGKIPLASLTGGGREITPQEFIEIMASIAMELGPKYSIFPSVLIANAAQECTWGRSPLVRDCNNLGGVKAYDDWTGGHSSTAAPSGEDNGATIYYRAYESINAAMEDKAMVLQNNRYDKIRQAKTPEASLLFHALGYAGDSSKDDQLLSIITSSQYNLKQYDIEYNALLSSGKIKHTAKTREDIIAGKYFN